MKKALFFVLALVAATGTALADVPSGTHLQGVLSANLSSATAQVGDPVQIENVQDPNGAFSGYQLLGHVTQVQKAGQGTRAQLNFVIDRLVAPDGTTYSVIAQSEGIAPKSNAGRETTGALLGVAAGALLGKALGGSASSMIIGAAAGGAAGFAISTNNRQDIAIPQGSIVKVLLTSVTRVQSH
jgi:outer membrane lipoprotein SlyB